MLAVGSRVLYLLAGLALLPVQADSNSEREFALSLNEPSTVSFPVERCAMYRLRIEQLGADVEVEVDTGTRQLAWDNPLHLYRPEVGWFNACPETPVNVQLRAKLDQFTDGLIKIELQAVQPNEAELAVFEGDLIFSQKRYADAKAAYLDASEKFETAERLDAATYAVVSAATVAKIDSGVDEAQRILNGLTNKPSIDTLSGMLWHFYRASFLSDEGKADEALEVFSGLLESESVQVDIENTAAVRNQIGVQQISLQQLGPAREQFDMILSMEDLADASLLVTVLNNMGGTYYMDNDPQRARHYFEESAKASLKLGDLPAVADARGNLVAINLFEGRFNRALSDTLQLLELQEQIGEPVRIARGRNVLGHAYYRLGELNQAFAHVSAALSERIRLGQAREGLQSAMTLAQIARARGNKITANGLALAGLIHAEAIEDENSAARALMVLLDSGLFGQPGLAWFDRWLLSKAQLLDQESLEFTYLQAQVALKDRQYGQAIESAEHMMRLADKAMRPDFQITAGQLLAAATQDPRLQQKYLGEAYQRSKTLWLSISSPQHLNRYAEELSQLLVERLDICAAANSKGCERELLLELDSMRQFSTEPYVALSQSNSTSLEERESLMARLRFANSNNAGEEILQRLLLQLDAFDEDLSQQSSVDHQIDLESLQQSLKHSQMLVVLVTADEDLYRWRFTRDAMRFDSIALASDAFSDFSNLVLEQAPLAKVVQQGQGLGDVIFGEIDSNITEILLLPDSRLATFPFAALRHTSADTSKWLIETAKLRVLRDLRVNEDDAVSFEAALLVGGVDYQDQEPLPFSKMEVAQIGDLFEATETQVELLTGKSATAQATLNALESGAFSIAHIAAHGVVNPTHPEMSEILLAGEAGRSSRLGFGDVLFGSKQLDLVVLSACDSALGYPGTAGPINIAQALGTAAKARVVASLWAVGDASSAALFQDFYRQLIMEKRSGAEALARAQRRLADDRRFGHPYYWAGYTYISPSARDG